MDSHCNRQGWNRGGNLGWARSGEDVAPSAWRGCGLVPLQGYFGDLGGAGTLSSPIWQFRALTEQILRACISDLLLPA